FVNKMDLANHTKEKLLEELNRILTGPFIDFNDMNMENLALNDEVLLRKYFAEGKLDDSDLSNAILERRIFPVYFGSALKDVGVTELLDGMVNYLPEKQYGHEFGGRIFKVAYDENAARLCYLKVTGGVLKTKDQIDENNKADEIRMMSGKRYRSVSQAEAGDIVAIKGFSTLLAGQTLGAETGGYQPQIESCINYRIIAPAGCDMNLLHKQLDMLKQEDPQIAVHYGKAKDDIQVRLMGPMQQEAIASRIMQRCGINIKFGEGSVVYKETIAAPVKGYGHFEPLRHYSEVHVLLTPLPPDSGIRIRSIVPEDDLARHWQAQIINALKSTEHVGILTGSQLTDVDICVVAGRAHEKHTEGGDFRQAASRAVRQALTNAENILLEPYDYFEIVCPPNSLSSILHDLDNAFASYEIETLNSDSTLIRGQGPYMEIESYRTILPGRSGGKGTVMTRSLGYRPCHNSSEVIERIGYEREGDLDHPASSVFCSHGESFLVPAEMAEEYMHIKPEAEKETASVGYLAERSAVSDKELARVVASINGQNRNQKKVMARKAEEKKSVKKVKPRVVKPRMLIADGYNLMYGWDRTHNMMGTNMEGAREIVINELVNYRGYLNCELVIVFDAYRIRNENPRAVTDKGITIVYTRQGQTADSYIEKLVHDNIEKYDITVATSDQAVQNMVLGAGARRKSAREIELELQQLRQQ
ncbi:MAG: TetM/TetW/TetO/TetS family tetracycline resistance ribosomal protection protein, partial [Erysipelotrichaceae bacterium]|nr:TetM/TetW/TetO/TetS family tetracycline resistance ribosomal protection protein [Erysipelotrichaceae bacterium]